MTEFLPSIDDLEILGIDGDRFVRRSAVAAGIVCVAVGAIMFMVSRMIGGISPVAVVLLVFAAPGYAWTVRLKGIASSAEIRRGDMDLAVAVFLDIVNVLLAGGAGVETSMLAAASAGDGWAFDEIRLALAKAQSSRRSYWDALSQLGARLRVDSLEDVSHSVQLAGEHGARVRQSLVAKAQALRTRNLARIEHEAEQRTEHMGLPIVLLFMGFILLVGYPAFAGTLAGL